MDKHTDVVIVGAGPAGLAAACAARSCGLTVTLLDEQAAPGGQLLRNVESPLAQALMDPGNVKQACAWWRISAAAARHTCRAPWSGAWKDAAFPSAWTMCRNV